MTRKREQWSASKRIFDAGRRRIVWFASMSELEVIGRITTGKVSAAHETAGAPMSSMARPDI
jgi:hypothetical protein